jgi:hypothetical protein
MTLGMGLSRASARYLSIIMTLVITLAAATPASAAKRSLASQGLGRGSRSISYDASNQSFLMSLQTRVSTQRSDIFTEVLNPDTALALRQRYEDLNRSYEARHNAHVTTPKDEADHHEQLRALTKDLYSGLRSYNGKRYNTQLRRGAQEGKVITPVMVSGTVVATYFGNPVNVTLGGETRLDARTDMPGREGDLHLASPVCDATVQFRGNEPVLADNQFFSRPAEEQKERYRVSIVRSLPVLNLSSSISYGSTTSRVITALSRPITSNVTAVVDSVRPTNGAVAAIKPGEQRLQLIYGITF